VLTQLVFYLIDPCRQYLVKGYDRPLAIALFLHTEYDSVPPVIYGIDRENIIIHEFHFTDVKLTEAATSFDQARKMDNFGK
jgi:hypothetical protein